VTAPILTAALLLSCAAALSANDPLSMADSPAQSFAPTNLTIRVHIEPDADNRALEIVVESAAYYRSSRVQMDGAEAPRTISIEFRNVPGGDSDVKGTLIDSAAKGRAAVRQHVIVLGSAERE
jgi:hypothetical protein